MIHRIALNDGELIATEFGFGIHHRGMYTPTQVYTAAKSLVDSFPTKRTHPDLTDDFFQYCWCKWDKLSTRAATEMIGRVRLNSDVQFDPIEHSHNYAGTKNAYALAWNSYIPTEHRLTALYKAFKRKHFNNRRLLDLGCAGGRHLLQLAAHGFDTYGIEANPRYFTDLHPMIRERVAYGDALVDTWWSKPDSFDVVICSAHGTINWPELEQLLSEITRILIIGGVLLFDVPMSPLTLGPRQQNDFRIYARLLRRCGFKVHMLSYDQLVCTVTSKAFNMAASI
jgi:SAM-dependent methyltransferase